MKNRWLFAFLAALLLAAALPGTALATPTGIGDSRIYDLKHGLLAGLPAAAGRPMAAGRDITMALVPAGSTRLQLPRDGLRPLLCLVNTRDGSALYRRQPDGRKLFITSRPRSQAAAASLWCVVDRAEDGAAVSGSQAIRPSAVPDALWRRINSRNGFDV